MSALDFNLDAYRRISDFELLLRRILRWELMSENGRSWLTCLEKNYGEIESRIAYEKKKGVYSEDSSELSYLTLQELINIIFYDFWKGKFDQILNYDRGMLSILSRQIVPIRNKVAHFRLVDILDQQSYRAISELEDLLRRHYSDDRFIVFYLSSDPGWVNESIDQDYVDEIQSELRDGGFESVWDDYSRFEGVRAYNVSTGLGLFCKNIFIELYVDHSSPHLDLAGWIRDNKFTVNLISVNKTKIRVFWPLCIGAKEIRKGFNGLAKMIARCHRENNADNLFGHGASEQIVRVKQDKSICIAF